MKNKFELCFLAPLRLPRGIAGVKKTSMLKDTFYSLCTHYSDDTELAGRLWNEIEKQYTAKGRHYHNLGHLRALITELEVFRPVIEDWNTILFSTFYHDIIYKVHKNDNEEQSAQLAAKRLTELYVPAPSIARCRNQILATKTHNTASDKDTNLFTDADLSVLGKPRDIYDEYTYQIRKEYNIYPDLLYIPGRKKVLTRFLAMDLIFKTTEFAGKYEQQARENIEREFKTL